MYDNPQPGHLKLCTIKDLLNSGVLSFKLVKKESLVVCYKTTTFTEAVPTNELQTLRIQLANNCSHFCLGKEVVSK